MAVRPTETPSPVEMSSAVLSHAPPSPSCLPSSSMAEIAQRPRPRENSSSSSSSYIVSPAAASPEHLQRPERPSSPTGVTPNRELKKVAVDKQSIDYLWRSGVAGGIAGSVAKTIVAPLDRVKILFQASNPQFAKYSGSWAGVAHAMRIIYQQDGVMGLYRGHSATLLRVFPYAAVKFIAYEQIRSFLIPRKENETPLRRLLSGSLAGVTSVFVTYPLEVIRVRLAFETRRDGHSSLAAICRRIYTEQSIDRNAKAATAASRGSGSAAASVVTTSAMPRSGLSNFYRGFSPTILGMLPYAGMSFLTHDTCGDILRLPALAKWTTLPIPANAPPDKPAPLRSWAELLAGGVAGLVSQTASYPLEVIRRRMQVGGAVGDGHRLRITETASLIMRERGFRGFFVGLTIGYVKIVPMAAAAFYTYERLKRFFGI